MKKGFTIVELLIVIVVIGILAAITIVSFNSVQDKARQVKIQQDLQSVKQAISTAQIQTGGTLKDIIQDYWVGEQCSSVTPGTNLASLSRTDGCWTRYASALDKISTAGGANIRNLVDPWGRPYWIDSNEGESATTPCTQDNIAVYALPTNSSSTTNNISLPNVLAACM